MFEDEIRRIAREVVREELGRLRSERADDPLTAGQVRLVHARRATSGVSADELRAELGERRGVDSLTDLSQAHMDDLLFCLATREQ